MASESTDTRAGVYDTVVRHAARLDDRDAEGAARFFTEDCSVRYVHGAPISGRARLAVVLRRALNAYLATSHDLHNFLCEPVGVVVHASTYVSAWHRFPGYPGVGDLVIKGRYLDQLIRVEDHWEIQSRQLEVFGLLGQDPDKRDWILATGSQRSAP